MLKTTDDLRVALIMEKSEVTVFGRMTEYNVVLEANVVGTDGLIQIVSFSHETFRHRVPLGTLRSGKTGRFMEIRRHFDRNRITTPQPGECRKIRIYAGAAKKDRFSPTERKNIQIFIDALVIRLAPQHASIFKNGKLAYNLMTEMNNRCTVQEVMDA